MMSVQEERREVIKECIPKLIESLTKFKRNEENFKRCEEFTWNTLKNYKSISVSSHDVKRKIEGMREKFIVGNYEEQSNNLQKLCNIIINHPICNNHYEFDIQWSVLEFIFGISYNPVGSLRNLSNFQIQIIKNESNQNNNEHDYLINELKEDFVNINKQYDSDDSDLSEWSDSISEDKNNQSKIIENEKSNELDEKRIVHFNINSIPKPQKQNNYTLIKINKYDSNEFLKNHIQNSWWIDNLSNNYKICNSDDFDANFCFIWNEYLLKTKKTINKNLLYSNEISTITEYQLLHEIIWMFFIPQNYKCFEIDNDNNIKIRNNVSIPSLTLDGFKNAVEFFIPYIKIMNDLRIFIKSVYNGKNQQKIPKTYEFYAEGLSELLQDFYNKLLNIEKIIKSETEIYTVLRLMVELNDDFKYLETLYYIHENCILDYTKIPAHICSAFLLINLLKIFETSSRKQMENIAISLFLSSIKVFCYIIDIWWTDGRLDDWKNEFVVEKSVITDEICSRLYSKSRERSFFVSSEISKIIQNNDFFKLLMKLCLEAGYTLNLLFQINQIGNLRNTSNFKENLYNSFINDVLLNVENFKENKNLKINENKIEENIKEESKVLSLYENSEVIQKKINYNNFLNDIEDDLLRMVFKCTIKNVDLKKNQKNKKFNGINFNNKNEKNTKEIYDILNLKSNIILPLEEIICKSFSNILQLRISYANEFVIKIYNNEFEILKNLQNLRKILLLESSDLMHNFYIKLFNQIESGKNWMNPFILTIQLDDMISSAFPELSSLFRIEFNSDVKHQTNKVVEAVDELFITYNLRKELKNIITDTDILKYNKVFRFLLKVKWAMWTLENLKFSKLHKKRLPYAELTIIDFLMRRLEQIRFWLIYSIQSIHFHLMTHVLQTMGLKLNDKIKNCNNLSEMKNLHESYINTICKHCFITDSGNEIRNWIEQLFHIIYVVKLEWECCLEYIESNNYMNDSSEENDNYATSCKIDEIESSYIRLHQYLAKILNNEVYVKQQSWLSGLSAAFNTSVPY